MNDWSIIACKDPNHTPPGLISVKPGQVYQHKCPSCGHITTIIVSDYICKEISKNEL